MWIEKIRLSKFRNYFYQQIDFNRDINIFLGDNAQGKTNLLEAIYYLANGKSFKKSKVQDMIYFGEGRMDLSGKIRKDDFYKEVEIGASPREKNIRVNGISYSTNKDLKALFKLVLFRPEDLNIVKEGPAFRRELFDDIIGSCDPSYKLMKQRYDRVLLQRNKLLKEPKGKFFQGELEAYDKQIIRLGFEISQRREKFIGLISTYAQSFHYNLSEGREELSLAYRPDIGGEGEKDYGDAFLKARHQDLKYRTTSRGIHRDEVDILINDRLLKNFGSQGQQKSAIIDIKLAQVELIRNSSSDQAIILFDDCLSELDEKRAGFLLQNLGDNQTIITATNTKSLEEVDKSKIRRIKNGKILD